ncbi:MAG TPA: tetratricopeptide repeat protein [Pyrinomonadaceae bacterium]|nr:tetratricopeptide repeat protein [Pyrinomonadaceae bacterium]
MLNQAALDWVQGRASLGAAGGWTAEEMRLVADLAYALAEQGRHDEAITVFDGLAAVAPATAYFQAALGALWLRKDDPARALEHLNAALAADPRDITALTNRGEAFMRAGDRAAAERDFEEVLRVGGEPPAQTVAAFCVTRARALLLVLRGQTPTEA